MAKHKVEMTRGRSAMRRINRRQKLAAILLLMALPTGGFIASQINPSSQAVALATTSDSTTTVDAKTVKFDTKTALTSKQLIADNTRTSAASRDYERPGIHPQVSADDGSWGLSDSSSSDPTQKTVLTASNPVVKVLLNSRDTDSIPAGFNPDHASGDSGANGYPYGQCTWWAYKRRVELGLPVGSNFGNGSQWAASAQASGYWVDGTPRQGDVAVFAAGQQGSDPVYGHVAVVEKVYDDGSIEISESNVNGQVGPFQRTVSKANAAQLQYIHY